MGICLWGILTYFSILSLAHWRSLLHDYVWDHKHCLLDLPETRSAQHRDWQCSWYFGWYFTAKTFCIMILRQVSMCLGINCRNTVSYYHQILWLSDWLLCLEYCVLDFSQSWVMAVSELWQWPYGKLFLYICHDEGTWFSTFSLQL